MDLHRAFDANFENDRTPLTLLFREGVSLETVGGRRLLRVEPESLRRLASQALHDANFFFRPSHLEAWAAILDDPAASENDRFTAAALLKNAVIAAEGVLPACQDTGTAAVVAFKGESVWTGGDDAVELEEGIRQAYASGSLRASQVAPLSMFEERNTGSNLPAQVEIYAVPGESYRFLFLAKGGGSSNKTALFQETKALLNEEAFCKFLAEKVPALGVAACPPYYLALVVGGTSPEFNLKLLKLASAGALDYLPQRADGSGAPYRDPAWEQRLLTIAADTGLGAQFGGRYLALSARVIRCGRHGGSCPVSLGVSCSAHRNVLAQITADGIFLETLDHNPARFLPKALEVLQRRLGSGTVPVIQLDRPLDEICRELGKYPVGALVRLTGSMLLARDAAHARWRELLRQGLPLPGYLLRYPIFYAGPAGTEKQEDRHSCLSKMKTSDKTDKNVCPPGLAIGSLGPTTAQRMDGYLDELMARGASLVTLGKGNRMPAAVAACKNHGGFFLATLGGAAALLTQEHVPASEVIDYADLGMEAVRRVEVRNLPAMIVIDDKGGNLYI
ncbi:MAG: fumarate hydratase [Pirellulales bacterium]|nr:fumarate hydratase [Pirellulales bacterium]